jgi:hypothetical protein
MLWHRRFASLTLAGIVLTATPAVAQHTHAPAGNAAQDHQQLGDVVSLFPHREASGTAWLPDATPMYGIQRTWGDWELMLHGLAFAHFLYEPGDIHRTGGFSTHQVGSVNWGMLHAREYGASVFTVGKLQGGYVRYLAPRTGLVPGFGGTLSMGVVPRELTRGYYRRFEPGFGLFFALRPARHVM